MERTNSLDSDRDESRDSELYDLITENIKAQVEHNENRSSSFLYARSVERAEVLQKYVNFAHEQGRLDELVFSYISERKGETERKVFYRLLKELRSKANPGEKGITDIVKKGINC